MSQRFILGITPPSFNLSVSGLSLTQTLVRATRATTPIQARTVSIARPSPQNGDPTLKALTWKRVRNKRAFPSSGSSVAGCFPSSALSRRKNPLPRSAEDIFHRRVHFFPPFWSKRDAGSSIQKPTAVAIRVKDEYMTNREGETNPDLPRVQLQLGKPGSVFLPQLGQYRWTLLSDRLQSVMSSLHQLCSHQLQSNTPPQHQLGTAEGHENRALRSSVC